MQKIHPCLWFNGQVYDAATFYSSLFTNSNIGKIAYYGQAGAKVSGQEKGSVMTVEFELAGQNILGLNGGDDFKFTPAMSFFVWCDTEDEINDLWEKLSKNGNVRMKLDKYSWANKYGWTTDQYGVEWQMMLSRHTQKIAPAFLFVDKLFGKGTEAINFYMSVFKNSEIKFMKRTEDEKSIMHCIFSLAKIDFVLMEGQGEHAYTFSPAFSLVVNCETQDEIDEYWEKLSHGGSIVECGWLTDKYGVSWQIVPTILSKYMSDADPAKSEKVMKAMLKMKKLDIKKLEEAYVQ